MRLGGSTISRLLDFWRRSRNRRAIGRGSESTLWFQQV
jgi:hypothetical protein